MEDESNVLFVRGSAKNTSSTVDDDVWDDSALIKAYDKAVNLAKDQVAKRMGIQIESYEEKSSKAQSLKQPSHGNKPCRKWTVGSPCRATYATDGEVYEAIVTKIYENYGTCIVKFVGYGNTEKVELSSLLESEGLESQIAQQKSATAYNDAHANTNRDNGLSNSFGSSQTNGETSERMDYEAEKPRKPKNSFLGGHSFDSSFGIMPHAPPIPPQLMANLPENDADALSSMLMSWYISGFHTGYYHGIKHARQAEEKRKK